MERRLWRQSHKYNSCAFAVAIFSMSVIRLIHSFELLICAHFFCVLFAVWWILCFCFYVLFKIYYKVSEFVCIVFQLSILLSCALALRMPVHIWFIHNKYIILWQTPDRFSTILNNSEQYHITCTWLMRISFLFFFELFFLSRMHASHYTHMLYACHLRFI